MLLVTPVTDRSGRYYLDDTAPELAAVLPGRRGRWLGAGAPALGFAGPVEAPPLRALLAGCPPGTRQPLLRRPPPVAAYDLTFAAPKSVSLLALLADPATGRQVVAAHDRAIEGAMGYLEQRALSVRRGTAEDRQVLAAGGVVGAAFTHGSSRALEPHLHTHLVLANLGHGADGRWSALDGRALWAHRRAAGQLYQAALRHELTHRLEVGWVLRHHGGFEVEGMDPIALGALSSRRAEIAEHRHGRGAGGGGAPSGRVAALATRDPKAEAAGRAALAGRWRAQLERAGTGSFEPARVLGRARAATAQRPPAIDEYRFAAACAGPSLHRRQVVEAWAGALRQGSQPDDLSACVDRLVSPLAGERRGVGVAEASLAPAQLVPSPHLLAALGGRPATPEGLAQWQAAAQAIGAYRARWGVAEHQWPLGALPPNDGLAGLGTRRLADHLATQRVIDEARRRLGRVSELEGPGRARGLG